MVLKMETNGFPKLKPNENENGNENGNENVNVKKNNRSTPLRGYCRFENDKEKG